MPLPQHFSPNVPCSMFCVNKQEGFFLTCSQIILVMTLICNKSRQQGTAMCVVLFPGTPSTQDPTPPWFPSMPSGTCHVPGAASQRAEQVAAARPTRVTRGHNGDLLRSETGASSFSVRGQTLPHHCPSPAPLRHTHTKGDSGTPTSIQLLGSC